MHRCLSLIRETQTSHSIFGWSDGNLSTINSRPFTRRGLRRIRRTDCRVLLDRLNGQVTRLIEFGRYEAGCRAPPGLGKPETFNFLGFTVDDPVGASSSSNGRRVEIGCEPD